jgi:chromosome segregation ATPase
MSDHERPMWGRARVLWDKWAAECEAHEATKAALDRERGNYAAAQKEVDRARIELADRAMTVARIDRLYQALSNELATIRYTLKMPAFGDAAVEVAKLVEAHKALLDEHRQFVDQIAKLRTDNSFLLATSQSPKGPLSADYIEARSDAAKP